MSDTGRHTPSESFCKRHTLHVQLAHELRAKLADCWFFHNGELAVRDVHGHLFRYPETKGERRGNNSADHTDPVAHRRAARLAVQPQLGILSQRHPRGAAPGVAHTADSQRHPMGLAHAGRTLNGGPSRPWSAWPEFQFSRSHLFRLDRQSLAHLSARVFPAKAKVAIPAPLFAAKARFFAWHSYCFFRGCRSSSEGSFAEIRDKVTPKNKKEF